MKTRLFVAIILVAGAFFPTAAITQQSQQPIKYFGYAGADNDGALNQVSPYTNFSYISGSYGVSIIDQVTAIKNHSMRAVIDLGNVLWCQDDPNNSYGTWHLCSESLGDQSYIARWNDWTSMNGSVLDSSNILAFSIITEQISRGIPAADIQAATSVVKQRYPGIPTMAIDSSDDVINAYYGYYGYGPSSFRFPSNLDWVGVFKYYTHPNLDGRFKDSISLLKLNKQSYQRVVYVMDGFYNDPHIWAAPTVYDMDQIAQEWYLLASQDPEAILLGVFLWPDIPGENAIGSGNFPPIALNKQLQIGGAILGGRVPTYQGAHDYIDCGAMITAGWALDASVPNTPVSVDLVVDNYVVFTQRADHDRGDVGQHGFVFALTRYRDGQPHQIAVRYSGTTILLPGSPKSFLCSHP
jgi:hypothetical protein